MASRYNSIIILLILLIIPIFLISNFIAFCTDDKKSENFQNYPWYIRNQYWFGRHLYESPYQHNYRKYNYGYQKYPYHRGYNYYW